MESNNSNYMILNELDYITCYFLENLSKIAFLKIEDWRISVDLSKFSYFSIIKCVLWVEKLAYLFCYLFGSLI